MRRQGRGQGWGHLAFGCARQNTTGSISLPEARCDLVVCVVWLFLTRFVDGAMQLEENAFSRGCLLVGSAAPQCLLAPERALC